MQVAVVAIAGKIVKLCWQLATHGTKYAFAQPSLVAHKHRQLELRAGTPATRGRTGTASGYSLKAARDAERLAEQADAGQAVSFAVAGPHGQWRDAVVAGVGVSGTEAADIRGLTDDLRGGQGWRSREWSGGRGLASGRGREGCNLIARLREWCPSSRRCSW
jgi:hypothetical protein